ncbi:MAG: hypothetical protein ACKOXF_02460 [Chitinophagaceae bacterium]
MKKLFLLLLLIFSIHQVSGQGIDTDSTHHYIVMRSKSPYKLSYVIGESRRIRVADKKGHSAKGRLYFINDSTVRVINAFTLRSDTFKISSISNIRTATLFNQITGISGLFVGGVWCIAGAALVGSSAGASSSYAPIALFFGLVAIASSIPIMITGAAMLQGRNLRSKHYDLKLHTAKGYKLKRKHLKYLYPRA